MPPRAPVVWATTAVRGERFRKRRDARHRELTIQAKARGRTYRRSRADPASEQARRLRADFLAALGRLASFEVASLGLARCHYDVQLTERADDLSRDYFPLWHMVARHAAGNWPAHAREDELLDYSPPRPGRP